jgi:hypothetical protein
VLWTRVRRYYPRFGAVWLFATTVVVVLWWFAHVRAVRAHFYESQWYLVQPPLKGEQLETMFPDSTAPLWRWDISETYKSEEQCGSALKRIQAENHRGTDPGKYSNLLAGIVYERCVAAVDPDSPHTDKWLDAQQAAAVEPTKSLDNILVACFFALLLDVMLIVVWEPMKQRDYPAAFSRTGAVLFLVGIVGLATHSLEADEGELLDSESPFWPSFWITLVFIGTLLIKVAAEYENQGKCFLCSTLRYVWGASYRCPLSKMVRAGRDQ